MGRGFFAIIATSACCAFATETDDLAAFRVLLRGWHRENAKVDVRPAGRGHGLGVFATAEVARGEVILRVPPRYCLSCAAAVARADGSSGERAWLAGMASEKDCLAAWLLVEKAKRDRSDWAAWLRVLPARFDSPLLLDDLKHVQHPVHRSTIVKWQETSESSYKRFALRGAPAALAALSLQEWRWAHLVLSTRAWHIKGKVYLVAGAGMFNHDLDAADKQFRPESASGGRSDKFLETHYFDAEGFAVVRSDRSAGPGEQIFESYGDNPSHIYFVHHGFVPAVNPYDCFDLHLPRLPSAEKTGFLTETRVPATVCIYASYAPPPFLLYAAVSALKDSELHCLRDQAVVRGGGRAVGTRGFFEQVNRRLAKCAKRKKVLGGLEAVALREAAAVLKREVADAPTTPAHDERLLQRHEEDWPPAVLAAVRYRLQQKILLVSAADMLEERAAGRAVAARRKKEAKRASQGREQPVHASNRVDEL
ncbi:hypothetical protein DIPPA_09546 [Diplonema papillatum]|nr:hypothetical protein DIPPA_09546 [Diplonema papillatum]KAJ9445948.1 hypothetical protein DIPPA_09546 [Diplonema papillatum]